MDIYCCENEIWFKHFVTLIIRYSVALLLTVAFDVLAYVSRLIGGEPEQLVAKYIIEERIYFKAINGLTKGVYGYKITQYDKDNNIIMENEFNYFDIGFSIRPVGRVNR